VFVWSRVDQSANLTVLQGGDRGQGQLGRPRQY
jgi:hypothetical protein